MKVLVTVFLAFFLSKGCSNEQSFKDVNVAYNAHSRGFYKSITIEENSFQVAHKRDEKPKTVILTEAQWKKIAELYAKIDLKNMNDLAGTTTERATDKKPFANMTIQVKEKKYTTKDFDHTIPPAKIKEFVDYINELADNSISKTSILGNYKVEELLAENLTEQEYQINFDAKNVSGFMGCNFFSGTYELDAEAISFGNFMATKKYCEAEMNHESTWFKVASEVTNFKLENDTLLLFDSQNKVLLKAIKKQEIKNDH